MSTRVLFACWPFEGHVFPLLSIALALRSRGHEVAFYTGPELRETIEHESIQVFPFERVDAAWARVRARERAVGGRRQSLRVAHQAFREWLVETIPGQVDDIRGVIDEWRPDVIVADASMWGPSLVLHEAEPIPVALVSTLLYALVPGPEMPLAGLRLPPPRSPAQLALARLAARGIDWVARGTRLRLDQVRGSYGLGRLGCSVNEFLVRLPLYLIGSLPELDLNRWDLPSSIRYVGALTWHPPESPETTAWLDGLRGDVPLVHVTEGTSHQQQPFLLRAAAEGLANAGVEAVLTTGAERDPGTVWRETAAPNVHLVRWVSHSELLPRCSAVVTTGGAQTIVAALRAGVPLVIVPTGWDKPPNAMRAVRAGVAVWLPARRCTPERLLAAVRRVLEEPSYSRAAREVAQRFAQAPGPRGAAELIEGLALPLLASLATEALHV